MLKGSNSWRNLGSWGIRQMRTTNSVKGEPRLIMINTMPRRSFKWDRKCGLINQDLGSSLVSSSINGLVLVLSLVCFLRELWRFIVHSKITHSRWMDIEWSHMLEWILHEEHLSHMWWTSSPQSQKSSTKATIEAFKRSKRSNASMMSVALRPLNVVNLS